MNEGQWGKTEGLKKRKLGEWGLWIGGKLYTEEGGTLDCYLSKVLKGKIFLWKGMRNNWDRRLKVKV